jgi:hypothetical protein
MDITRSVIGAPVGPLAADLSAETDPAETGAMLDKEALAQDWFQRDMDTLGGVGLGSGAGKEEFADVTLGAWMVRGLPEQ